VVTAFPNDGYTSLGSPTFVAVADFNGDGYLDLAVASEGVPPVTSADDGYGTVSVLLNAGDGVFGVQTTYAVGTFALSLAVGDYNGDGRPDLAVANNDNSSVGILLSECQ
jgi:hypothetical protein